MCLAHVRWCCWVPVEAAWRECNPFQHMAQATCVPILITRPCWNKNALRGHAKSGMRRQRTIMLIWTVDSRLMVRISNFPRAKPKVHGNYTSHSTTRLRPAGSRTIRRPDSLYVQLMNCGTGHFGVCSLVHLNKFQWIVGGGGGEGRRRCSLCATTKEVRSCQWTPIWTRRITLLMKDCGTTNVIISV